MLYIICHVVYKCDTGTSLCDSKSHFNRSLGNVKAFTLKKLKLSLSPSPQWPQAACGWGATAGKFLRKSLGRTVFGLESFESIPETSRSSVETCTWAI